MGEVGNTAVIDKNQPTPKPTTQPAQTPKPTVTGTPTQTPTATPTQPVTQTDVMFFLQNQVNIILAVSSVLIGAIIIALTITRRKNVQLTKRVGEQT